MSAVAATGVGSMPGGDPLAQNAENARAYDEALRLVLHELPDLPHLPEMPGRGAAAGMTGRTLGMISGLGADLQPAGWRLTGGTSAGLDHRRATSQLNQDLDALEELGHGLAGSFKTQVIGPWSLAATVERPRGDRVLADHGARRELTEALAEAAATHVADLRRRLPGVTELLVQLDEPALPAVMAGRVPTASGFGRHRSVDLPVASEALALVLGAVEDAGAVPVVHCCAAGVPVDLLRGAGARGLSVDLDVLDASAYDGLAAALEAGERVLLGVVPALEPEAPPTDRSVAEGVERWLDMLGLEPSEQLVLTPSCGLAGATPGWVRDSLRLLRQAAREIS